VSASTKTLDEFAPEAIGALVRMESAAWDGAACTGLLHLTELIAEVCAAPHGLRPLAMPQCLRQGGREQVGDGGWRTIDGLNEVERSALEFAEQFSIEVSSISDRQRSQFFEGFAERAADLTAATFVMDFLPRTWAALDALPATTQLEVPRQPSSPTNGASIWEAIDTFSRLVVSFDTLDPVTSELVRLRGARQHQCRLCKSLRSRSALMAGAVESSFTDVDDYERGDLSPKQKAALSFTDAMIWKPGHLEEPVRRLTQHTSPEESVSLVLDITRNALNKIAVALRADQPHVADGYEIYDIDANGIPEYGLTID
jgi:alkylhydroperoxidase family enzyme